MPLTVVTPSNKTAVDLCTLKKHLRLVVQDCTEYTDEDDVLELMIRAACEAYQDSRKAHLAEETLRWDFKKFKQKLELARPPLISVTEVAYIDSNGAKQVITDDNYVVQKGIHPGYLKFKSDYTFPTDVNKDIDYPVQVTYKAGYSMEESNGVPPSIRLYLRNIIGTYYFQRESKLVSYTGSISIEDMKDSMTSLIAGKPKAMRLG